MAKFKVNIGGFVTSYRERTLVVYASNEAEAENKAIDRFVALQQQKPGNMCDEGIVNHIESVN